MRLQPWREVATPHPDVATGRCQQARGALVLWPSSSVRPDVEEVEVTCARLPKPVRKGGNR